jgi:hypothetical protein
MIALEKSACDGALLLLVLVAVLGASEITDRVGAALVVTFEFEDVAAAVAADVDALVPVLDAALLGPTVQAAPRTATSSSAAARSA